MSKTYTSYTVNRTPRPRSKRLREQGLGSTVYGGTTVLSGAAGNWVTLDTNQTISGLKTFQGDVGLNIGSVNLYEINDGVVYLNGDLVVKGYITMYADGGEYEASTLLDLLPIDETTLSKEGGVLSVIGGGSSILGIIVNGSTYTPVNGYITLPDYSTGSGFDGIIVNGSTYTPSGGYVTLPDYVTPSSLDTTLANYVTGSSLSTILADYVTSTALSSELGNYVTQTSLNTTLGSYVTNTALTTTLADYVTSSALTTELSNYVTNTALTSTLADYVTNTSLSNTLASYVTTSALNTTLSSYVTNSALATELGNYVTIATDQTITGLKTFEGSVGLNVGSVNLYEIADGVVYIKGDLVVKGYITMYADDGSAYTASTLLDLLPIDESTLSKDGGVLSVIDGGGSGLDGIIVNGSTYTPISGYITLPDYVTPASLTAELSNYVTSAALSTELGNYVTSTDLNTKLGDYVTNTSLNTTLSNYVTSDELVWGNIADKPSWLSSTVGSTTLPIYWNNGAPMACTASSLFSELSSSSSTNLSITVAGQTRSITNLYATYDSGGNNISSTYGRRRYSMNVKESDVSVPWCKFASIEVTSSYLDETIVFKVNQSYSGRYTHAGILQAHVRGDSPAGSIGNAQLYWEYVNSGITMDDFVLAYKSDTTNGVLYVELWVKISTAYNSYNFEVLSEMTRTSNYNTNRWTLYSNSSSGGESEITSGYTQVVSTAGVLQNAASKLGTSTVGGTATPIYLNAGTATTCSSTVGSATVPVYMSSGTITQCTASSLFSALSSSSSTNLSVTVAGQTRTTALYATYDSAGNNISSTYVTLATAQTITGLKTFTGGVGMNIGSVNLYEVNEGVIYLNGDLVVKGCVTMYADDGSTYTASTLLDLLPIDTTTLSKDGGVLSVIGGGSSDLIGINVNGSTYTPVNGYITLPDYSSAWDDITGKPSWLSSTVGSTTNPVYISSGTPTACTYSLNATVNSGTSGKLAYYSGANAISSYTSTIGSTSTPVYMNAGVPTALSSTVGAYYQPVYMNAGTITVCDELELGGRNLLLDSEKEYAVTNGFHIYNLTDYAKTILAGKNVVISFWAKSDTDGAMIDAYVRTSSGTNQTWDTSRYTSGGSNAGPRFTLTTEWTYCWCTVTVNDNDDSVYVYLRNNTSVSGQTVNSTAVVTTKYVKLELGTVPTDWTCAPEEAVAAKLGTSTVGGTATPIYLNAGTATACSSTVGSATTPVYMSSGTITQCTASSLFSALSSSSSTNLSVTVAGQSRTITSLYADYISSSTSSSTLYLLGHTSTSSGSYQTYKNSNIYTNGYFLNIQNSAGGSETGVNVYGSTTTIGFMIGSGNTNYGIYNRTQGAWTIYSTGSLIYLNQNSRVNGTFYITSTSTLSGAVTCGSSLTTSSYITMYYTSDERQKANIREVTGAGRRLLNIGKVYDFDYKAEAGEKVPYLKNHTGFMYQDVVKSELSCIAKEGNDGYGSINYIDPSLISLVCAGVQEHETRIEKLEKENKQLKKRIKELERRAA